MTTGQEAVSYTHLTVSDPAAQGDGPQHRGIDPRAGKEAGSGTGRGGGRLTGFPERGDAGGKRGRERRRGKWTR